MIYFYDEHEHEINQVILKQLEYIVFPYKEKVFFFESFMQITHLHTAIFKIVYRTYIRALVAQITAVSPGLGKLF